MKKKSLGKKGGVSFKGGRKRDKFKSTLGSSKISKQKGEGGGKKKVGNIWEKKRNSVPESVVVGETR